MRQLPELIAVLSNHGRLDLVDELPRVSGKVMCQSLYEVRIARELYHIPKQDAVDVLPLRLGIRSGKGSGAIHAGEHLIHPTQQRARVDRLGKKQIDAGIQRILTKICTGCSSKHNDRRAPVLPLGFENADCFGNFQTRAPRHVHV